MSSSIHLSSVQLFNALKKKLGDEVAEQVPNIATKDFVAAKVSEAKFQIILWAFVFWATQLGAIFAFLKLLS